MLSSLSRRFTGGEVNSFGFLLGLLHARPPTAKRHRRRKPTRCTPHPALAGGTTLLGYTYICSARHCNKNNGKGMADHAHAALPQLSLQPASRGDKPRYEGGWGEEKGRTRRDDDKLLSWIRTGAQHTNLTCRRGSLPPTHGG